MKKSLFLSALLSLAVAAPAVAEVTTDYTEGFEGTAFRPKGWRNVASSTYANATFTVNATGGHSGGCLAVNQYSDYYSTYYKNFSYADVLVTPKVKGTVSIWVKANGSKPQLTFYKMSDDKTLGSTYSAPSLVEGTEVNIVDGKALDNWTEIKVENVPETYIGIRAHNLYIDDFAASEATLSYATSVTADATNTSGSTNFEADSNNKMTVKFKVTLVNTGDTDITGPFDISLINATNSNKQFGTDRITDNLPFGATIEKEFSMTGDAELAPDTKSNAFRVKIAHSSLGEVEASLGYFNIIPYAPVKNLMLAEENYKNANNYTSVDIDDMITLGAGAAPSRKLWLWNSGTAPLKITAISCEGDFSADKTAVELAGDGRADITVSASGAPGLKTGKITFTDATLGDFSYDLQALVTDGAADVYTEDFEAETLPAGWIIPSGWKSTDAGARSDLAGQKFLASSSSSVYRLISPKLSFADGENFYFMATKTDNTSGKLSVYTSPDRVNWTEVKVIDTRSEDKSALFNTLKPTGTGYGVYDLRLFAIPMTAGETYIAFDAGGAGIDNLCGGKLVDVSHDIYVVDVNIPTVAAVNTRYITGAKLRNIKAETETGYAIVLEVDGKEVGRAAETPDLESGVDTGVEVTFTPHDAGTFPARLLFVSGDDTVELNKFEITVDEEKASKEYQVGVEKITTTDPFNTFYQGSQAQVIYTPEMLQMETGMKITGVAYHGYTEYEQVKHIKVWIENTEDTAYDPDNIVAAPTDKMTLVYDADYTFRPCGDNNKKEYEPVYAIEFSEPFEYTGKSLRIMTEMRTDASQDENASGKHSFYTVDNSAYDFWNDKYDNRCIIKKKEYAEDLDDDEYSADWYMYKTGYPVTYFTVAKDVAVLKGNITDDFGAAVEGAAVSLASDDILYKAVSDAEGNYSMNIANVGLTYTLDASAEGFDTFTEPDVTFSVAEEPVVTKDILLKWADRTATLTGHVENERTNGPLADATVSMGDVSTTTDADGNFSLTVAELTADYQLSVSYNDEKLYDKPYKFEAKSADIDILVSWEPPKEGLDGISADGMTVCVDGSTIIVEAPAGTAVKVYDTLGRLVGSDVADGSQLSFGPLGAGIYLVGNRKIVIR